MYLTRKWHTFRRLPALVAVVMLVIGTEYVAAAGAPLADAMKSRDMARAGALLTQKADVNAAQADGTTALHWAAYWDDVQMVQRLVTAGAWVGVTNRYKESPLSIASANANARVIEVLLNAGADANTTSGEGETVLMTAARKGSVDAVKTLLAHGANVNAAESWRQQTALMWAAGEDNVAVVKLLLEAGATANASAEANFTALTYAARNGANASGKLLLAAGADVNRPIEGGISPLMVAITNASYELAAAMIEWGADVNDTGMGFTALHQVIWSYHPPVSFHPPGPEVKGKTGNVDAMTLEKMLLDWGADPNVGQFKRHPMGYKLGQVGEYEGLTPLMLAARFEDVALMRLLLDYGADPTMVMDNNTNLLMVAAGVTAFMGEMPATKPGSYMETVKLAFEICGCDVNDQNGHGWTALHSAEHREGNDALRFLVSKGARLDIKSYEADINFPWRGEGKTVLRQAQGQFAAMSYKYHCDQQVVLRDLMKLPPAECVKVPPYDDKPLRGGDQ